MDANWTAWTAPTLNRLSLVEALRHAAGVFARFTELVFGALSL